MLICLLCLLLLILANSIEFPTSTWRFAISCWWFYESGINACRRFSEKAINEWGKKFWASGCKMPHSAGRYCALTTKGLTIWSRHNGLPRSPKVRFCYLFLDRVSGNDILLVYRYMQFILPRAEWANDALKAALLQILRRLDKVFSKISKKAPIRVRKCCKNR